MPSTTFGTGWLDFWNEWHGNFASSGRDRPHVQLRRRFLALMRARSRPTSTIDLGCGQGHDVAAFVRAGFDVVGVDGSPEAIRLTESRIPAACRATVKLHCLDIAEPLPYGDASFDGVYSHLALHYFDDCTTRSVFDEIARITKPGGLLVFSVKSVGDPLFGTGEKLADDIYRVDGHTRHFFSMAYARELLVGWDNVELSALDGPYANHQECGFIHAVAQRRNS